MIKHRVCDKMFGKGYELGYWCNQATSVTKEKIALNQKEVTCKRCLGSFE